MNIETAKIVKIELQTLKGETIWIGGSLAQYAVRRDSNGAIQLMILVEEAAITKGQNEV